MHIAIEGVDGVGKSTVCELLAKRLGFKFIEKPLHYLFDKDGEFENYYRIRDYVNLQTNKVFTSWFYGLGNIFLYHKFEGENIITDRHLVSNWFWSGDETSRFVFESIIHAIGKPDYTFVIYADESVVIQRLKNRDKDDSDLVKTHLIPKAYKKMEQFLIDFNMKYKIIDSNKRRPEELVEIIIQYLTDDPSLKHSIDGAGTLK